MFTVAGLHNHWCLKHKIVYYLDSQGHSAEGMDMHITTLKNIVWYFILEKDSSEEEDMVGAGWKIVTTENWADIPLQTTGADCGIFAVMYAYAWYIIEHKFFDFTVHDLPPLCVWLFRK